MTVSRALRGDRSIPPATRAKIRAEADALGYRPNPMVSALMARLRATRTPSYQATLAWLNDHPEPSPWRKVPYMRPYFEGARERAESLGYRLEEISLPTENPDDIDSHVTQARRILSARGMPGLVLPLNYRPSMTRRDWSGFAVAVLGRHKKNTDYSVPGHRPDPMPHGVSEDYFFNMRLACRSLRALGYRRIGWVSNPWFDAVTDSLYPAAFAQEQTEWPEAERLPPFLLPGLARPDTAPPPGFAQWIRRQRPDVLLGRFVELADWARALDLGARAPDLAHLGLAADVKGWSGIDPQFRELGAAAIDLVAAQLARNERDTPVHPKEVLIRGTWVAGRSTRASALSGQPRH